MRPAWSELTVFYPRFEKVIAILKPTELKPDPATQFWTVYKEVAGEYDDDLVSKYGGQLDTLLIFVSAFTSFCTSFASITSFCVRRVYSRPSLPRLLFKLSLHSSRIPSISQMSFSSEYYNKIPHLVKPTRWHPSRLSRSASSEPNRSSSQAWPSHYWWLLSPSWGNSGSYTMPRPRRGETLSIEGRNARKNSWGSGSGDCS